MKEKQQISKEIRQDIASINDQLAQLCDFPLGNLQNSSKQVNLPAIVFDENNDGNSGLREHVALLLGRCITCRNLLKDNSKAYIEYSNAINSLRRLLEMLSHDLNS